MRSSNKNDINEINEMGVIDVDWTNNVSAPHYSEYTEEERKKVFNIDRDAENKDVERFHKTGDVSIFEKLFEQRVPTLQVWARKHGHLVGGQDDMFGEFSWVFYKAVKKYRIKKGKFNNYLFTLLLNCVKNIKNGKRAKKRRPLNSDPNSIKNFLLSLEWGYYDKDGNGGTLKDRLSNTLKDNSNPVDNIYLYETIDILAHSDAIIFAFLKKLSDGESLTAVIKESKRKTGKIRLSRKEAKKLDARRKKSIAIELIKDRMDIKDRFSLLDYHVESNPNKLHYTIEMNKTHESDLLMKAIRKMRREEDSLRERISGNIVCA